MSNARNQILSRLYQTKPDAIDFATRHQHSQFDWSLTEKIERFTERMQAVRAEVHHAHGGEWVSVLQNICHLHRIEEMLVSPNNSIGEVIYASEKMPKLKAYEHKIEDWKLEMFHNTPASFTTTLGGIAETGTLILWPDEHEPRQMSLVPPIHIALLETRSLYSTFAEAIKEQQWVETGMPTNALLISGPSKSADIARVLAYGVHGPEKLIVILV